jgi:hypothetical protein
MSTNPINLGVRFLLEIAALVCMGFWGWQRGSGWASWLLAILIPLSALILWGVFNVPGDPSRSGKAPVVVPGILRLLLELVFFGLAVWMLYVVGGLVPSLIMGGAVLVHYLLSFDRIKWLMSR